MATADNDSEFNLDNHPALKDYSSTKFKIKHVLKKVAKWTVLGGVGSAATATALGAISSGSYGVLTGIASALIPAVGQTVAAATLPLIGGVAALGAAGGAIAALATSDSEQADRDEKERLIALYEREEARHERTAMLEGRREQQRVAMARQAQSLGINPNAGLPGRRESGAGLNA